MAQADHDISTGAPRWGGGLPIRPAWAVAGALVLTLFVLYSGAFEHFHVSDLNRIRSVEGQIAAACAGRAPLAQATTAADVLIAYYRRDHSQLLPLHGGGKADSMAVELANQGAVLTTGSCARLTALHARIATILASA
jgi:hypothetical protein